MTDQYRSQWPDRPESTEHPGISSSAPGPAYPPSPGFAVPARSDYANWGQRQRARLIDQAPTYVGLIIFSAGYLLWVVELAFSGGSAFHFEGAGRCDDHRPQRDARQPAMGRLQPLDDRRQDWTVLGKRVTKIRLIGEETQAPIGAERVHS